MADTNTRQGKRTPVTLKIKFKSETLEQFIERYAVDVSQGGIFIRTKEPLAVGTQMKFEFRALHRAFERWPRDFAVALPRVTIAGRKERPFDGDRQIERAALDQFFAVDVAAAEARRTSRVIARFARRQPQQAEERAHLDR